MATESDKITPRDELVSLRTEIVESEKARIDFLKYKLMAIASLSAIGLGFSLQNTNLKIESDYVLCIIPIVCAYVDLLCYHNTIRILVIAQFLGHYNDPYEAYICKLTNTRYLFNLEDFALHWSSMFVSVFIIIYSFVPFSNELIIKGRVFLLVGLLTFILNFLLKNSYQSHQAALFNAAKALKEKRAFNNVD